MSTNEGQSYQGPNKSTPSPGVYPATVEFDDSSFLTIYFEDSEGSTVRALHF